MAHYALITLAEMRDLLRPEKGWEEPVMEFAKEVVFDYHLKDFPHAVVRVYSSIERSTGVARKVGGDAIRVCAVDLKRDRGLIATTRVHRVEGWRENLKSRVLEVLKETHELLHRRKARSQYLVTESAPAVPQVNLLPIVTLLTDAGAALKHPKLSVSVDGYDLTFSVAGENAKIPGSINITDGKPYGSSVWYGRILTDGSLRLCSPHAQDQKMVAALTAFAADPVGLAKLHGHRTGSCCFCRLTLTTPESLTVGYGPVCAQHWGLPWGHVDEAHSPEALENTLTQLLLDAGVSDA